MFTTMDHIIEAKKDMMRLHREINVLRAQVVLKKRQHEDILKDVQKFMVSETDTSALESELRAKIAQVMDIGRDIASSTVSEPEEGILTEEETLPEEEILPEEDLFFDDEIIDDEIIDENDLING